jgi:hypothetical protein
MARNLNFGGVFEAALEIAQARGQLLARLREALEKHDDAKALELARRLAGIESSGAQ